jgi:hypothetical protein
MKKIVFFPLIVLSSALYAQIRLDSLSPIEKAPTEDQLIEPTAISLATRIEPPTLEQASSALETAEEIQKIKKPYCFAVYALILTSSVAVKFNRSKSKTLNEIIRSATSKLETVIQNLEIVKTSTAFVGPLNQTNTALVGTLKQQLFKTAIVSRITEKILKKETFQKLEEIVEHIAAWRDCCLSCLKKQQSLPTLILSRLINEIPHLLSKLQELSEKPDNVVTLVCEEVQRGTQELMKRILTIQEKYPKMIKLEEFLEKLLGEDASLKEHYDAILLK